MNRRDPAAGLGRTQKLVLHLLAREAKLVRTLAMDWPGLTEASVRTALTGLEQRGLVNRPTYHRGAYKFGLTDRGREVEAALVGDDEGEA